MGSQRVGHDWVTELNWTELNWRQIQVGEETNKHFIPLLVSNAYKFYNTDLQQRKIRRAGGNYDSPRNMSFTHVVQLPSHVQLFVTPWTTTHQASLTISWSLPKFTTIASLCQLAILSSDALFFCPQSLQVSGAFPKGQLFKSGDQNTGA